MSNVNRKTKILFILTGSIAAFKACQVISQLVQQGFEVKTVASPSALKFVGPATLEGLTGLPVLSDLWEHGRAMDHIALSRWADFGIVCPASANTLNKAAAGLGEDLIGNLLLAWPKTKTLHMFPAMNIEMWSHGATQDGVRTLKTRGFTVHDTGAGNLACGETGEGRLLEPDEILRRVVPARLGKILITAGATREPIDGIRYLSNVSTGQTGATLSDRLTALGWDVTFVHGEGSVRPAAAASLAGYGSFIELNETLRGLLAKDDYRAVIHAAAVSDYSIAQVNGEAANAYSKLSSGDGLDLKLKANFKILPRLKEYSRNKNIRVIGFKLTLNKSQEETHVIARGLIDSSHGNVDAVVANEWSTVNADRAKHPGQFLRRTQNAADHIPQVRPFTDLTELSQSIHEFIKEQTPWS